METLLASAIFVALLMLASLGVRIVEGLESENRLVEAELEASQLFRESLDSRAEQVRRYRHDADGLLRAIEHTLDPDTKAARGQESPGKLDRKEWTVSSEDCQLPLVDAAMQSKRSLCADAGIDFSCKVDPAFARASVQRGVNEVDLCVLLQNLLDNAYEESLRAIAAGVGPSMSLELVYRDGELRIAVSNRTVSDKLPEFRSRKARPELHGVGLQVVRDIVREHGGGLVSEFDSETRLLTITATLRGYQAHLFSI